MLVLERAKLCLRRGKALLRGLLFLGEACASGCGALELRPCLCERSVNLLEGRKHLRVRGSTLLERCTAEGALVLLQRRLNVRDDGIFIAAKLASSFGKRLLDER